MTCWIEDDLHNEEHMHPPTFPKGRRPCSIYCRDGVHATVAFVSSKSGDPVKHAIGQFLTHHYGLIPLEAEPAHEVTPEMYPARIHYGAPPEPGEKLVPVLVHFRYERPNSG